MDPRVIYCAPFFIAALLIAVVAVLTYRRRRARGAWYLTFVCLTAAIWAATEGMLYLGCDAESNMLITQLQYLGIATMPPLALLFGISVFGFEHWINRTRLLLLLFVAVAILVLVWTNPVHELVFTDYYTIHSGPFPMLGLEHGVLWWIIVSYHYLLVAILSAVVLFEAFSAASLHRSQALTVLIAVAAAWGLNAVYVSGHSPVPNMDIGPLAFVLVAASMAWGFFRYSLLDILPIARSEIFRGLDDAILVIDDRSRIIDINPATERMFGISVADAIGQETDRFFRGHPQLRELPARATSAEQVQVITQGQPRVLDYSVSALESERGGSLGRIIVFRDITETRRAEEEKRHLESQLTQSQKMETIGILAGGVAHDLNNILSGIVGYPDFLLRDLAEDDPLRGPLSTMQKSGEKAAAVVEDLLTLTRRGVASSETLNLNGIISEQLESPECEKLRSYHPHVDILTDLETDLPNAQGSTTHLSQTVMNLISNAAEAMPGGGEVLVCTRSLQLVRPPRGYDHVNPGRYVAVTVTDTGTGISQEDLDRIFEPFYTKKVMGRSGSGLGMSVVWRTVEDHDGYIEVESTEGEGTTFVLYFPVTEDDIAVDGSPASIDQYAGHGETVLVVDDVAEQREIATAMLEKLGYSVVSVSNGEEAIDHMRNHAADLLVLDMIMDPGIDGLETYREILRLHPGQKAIIASGFAESDRVDEARKLGAGRYIRKPYVLEQLGLAVKEELRQ